LEFKKQTLAFTKLKNCLACNSKKLRQVLDLNQQPLANSYLKNKNTREKNYELKVNGCLKCSHLQLSIAVDPKQIYKNYDYVSGTTQTYKNFMKKFYKFCIKKNNKIVYKNILDIGCNDGSQLDVFKSNKFKTYGVDPAKNIFKISSKKHKVICDFFTKKVVDKINTKFDFIISQNSFAHNPKPIQFLKNAKRLMHEKSLLIIQTSQADMCKNLEFDTIYHEHMSYHSLLPLKKFVSNLGLEIIDFERVEAQGGSIRIYVSHTGSFKTKNFKIKKQCNEIECWIHSSPLIFNIK